MSLLARSSPAIRWGRFLPFLTRSFYAPGRQTISAMMIMIMSAAR